MGEIKFRAWDKRQRRWVTQYVELRPDGTVSLPDLTGNDGICQPEDIVIVFFTGLKDKNGSTDIYEGDIIRWYDGLVQKGTNPNRLSTVRWHDTFAMFDGIHTGGEVIGNIYSNPELVDTR